MSVAAMRQWASVLMCLPLAGCNQQCNSTTSEGVDLSIKGKVLVVIRKNTGAVVALVRDKDAFWGTKYVLGKTQHFKVDDSPLKPEGNSAELYGRTEPREPPAVHTVHYADEKTGLIKSQTVASIGDVSVGFTAGPEGVTVSWKLPPMEADLKVEVIVRESGEMPAPKKDEAPPLPREIRPVNPATTTRLVISPTELAAWKTDRIEATVTLTRSVPQKLGFAEGAIEVTTSDSQYHQLPRRVPAGT